jgi:MtfA peptidase
MLVQWWRQTSAAFRRRRMESVIKRRHIDEHLWLQTVQSLPFLQYLDSEQLVRLRVLVSLFLHEKEFSGANGLVVTDRHAVMVATQACLPILDISQPDRPDEALAWYDSFVGIVLYPGHMKAQREWDDEAGVVHQGDEVLSGEVLEGGPLVLAWPDVATAGDLAQEAYNVVIHEFAHVMDLRDGQADGCPPMPRRQRQEWLRVLEQEYQAFQTASEQYLRFAGLPTAEKPLLDPYGSTSIDEFFAVAAEAYFVQPQAFADRHPALHAQFQQFFRADVGLTASSQA